MCSLVYRTQPIDHSVAVGHCHSQYWNIVCLKITDPIFSRKQFLFFIFLGNSFLFFTQIALNCRPNFYYQLYFQIGPCVKSFWKDQISRKPPWKTLNLDNTSRSNQVNSYSYYSFRIPRKFHRKTSDRVAATQSLSSVANRVLSNTQRSTGNLFSEQTSNKQPMKTSIETRNTTAEVER